jgi:hypothetical protein
MGRSLRFAVLALLVVSLVACGSQSAGVATGETPAAPKGAAVPKAGATYAGPIEISGKASAGTITLKVSDDGAAITSVSVEFTDLKCDGFSAGSMSKQVGGTFAISNGQLTASVSGIGDIKGRFASATEASGTAKITLDIMGSPCELGQFDWSAKAQ